MSKIYAFLRIRNEEAIIKDTLDHCATFATGGIVIHDDVSSDRTVEICKAHPSVIEVVEAKDWNKDRDIANFQDRQSALNHVCKYAKPEDWLVYLDADERIEFDWSKLSTYDQSVSGIRCKLFDYYITPEDVDKPYSERLWLGPEYREILMIFRNVPLLKYQHRGQREVSMPDGSLIIKSGYVKHYGKAISVEEWENTCQYYSGNLFSAQPGMRKKWLARRGKAIHDGCSDFKNPLILWEQKYSKGIKLTNKVHQQEFTP